MADGTTFKRCHCKNADGRSLGQKCPRLRRADGRWSNRHGIWYYQLELPPQADGKRRRPLRRGGFDSQTELGTARKLLAIAKPDDLTARIAIADLIQATIAKTRALPDAETVRRKVRTGQDLQTDMTLERWLDVFLKRKKKIEESTLRTYASHIRLYLKPYLGHVRIDQLRVADVADMFDAIEEYNDVIAECRASTDPHLRAKVKFRRPVGPATMHRIRGTLRHALNIAIKQDRLIDFNPAAVVELPQATRPKPAVWTDQKVNEWTARHQERVEAERHRRGGADKGLKVVDLYLSTPRPSAVMVWTPEQTNAFLDYARRHRLYALYRLIALRGLRRGEACGLRLQDIDLKTGTIGICWQLTQLGWDVIEGPPKTDASDRTVVLDEETTTVLRAHRKRRNKEQLAAGATWRESGFLFTNPDGTRLHPEKVTDQFHWLAYLAGLPPIRLHDLRHGAASLMFSAGIDVKIIQETLGHVSSNFTRDTYTSVFLEVAREAAETTAASVAAAKGTHGR